MNSKWIELWNRKLHMYAGLYFLFFLWLFSFSGLMLNHSEWEFAQFWPRRVETSSEQAFRPPAPGDDLDRAKDVVTQLGIVGEVERVVFRAGESRLEIQVARPGRIFKIAADMEAGRASIQRIDVDGWGVLHMLHTFNGVDVNNPDRKRDWFATTLWVVAMDAICVGLIVMVLSGLYMWIRAYQKRWIGWVLLGAGTSCCAFFIFGLKLL